MKQTNNNETTTQTETEDLWEGSEPALAIYAASLADYNAGRLHGRWIAVTTDADDIRRQIAEMLAESTEPIAEEWAIHDYEGFAPLRLSEWHNLDNLAAIAKGFEEHGEIFLHVLDYVGDVNDIEEANRHLTEQYCGEFESLEHWVEEFMQDNYGHSLNALPSVLQSCIDWERVAREFELGGDVFTLEVGRTVHVFWSNR